MFILIALIIISAAIVTMPDTLQQDFLTRWHSLDLFNRLKSLFSHQLVHLAIVRRYADANGHYVGELYKYDTFAGVGAYRLVGCSLDTLPLELGALSLANEPATLDLAYDFLATMPPNTLRVGATEPNENEQVKRMIGKLTRRNIRLVIQNKFIEHVMERKPA